MSEQVNVDTTKQKSLEKLKDKPSFTYEVHPSDLETRNECTVCNSSSLESLSTVSLNEKFVFFETSVCKDCGHVFRSTFPGFGWFTKCWEMIAREDSEPYNMEQEEFRAQRYNSYLNKIISSSEGLKNKTLRVLEVGAGYGHGINVFKEAGHEVDVIEAEIERRGYITRKFGINVVGGSINDLKALKNQYDIVVFSHCLEHVDHMSEEFQVLIDCLKDETARLYVEVPTLWPTITWMDTFFMAHKNNFTIETLKLFLDKFKVTISDEGFEETVEVAKGENFYCIIEPNPTKATKSSLEKIDDEYLNRVRNLYRKNAPDTVASDSELKFNVDEIENFFFIRKFSEDTKIELTNGYFKVD